MFKLVVDKDRCVGCGSCVAVCNNWEIGDDGKAKALKSSVKELGCNKKAQEICPVEAISVKS
jgi:ferredoxin